MGYSRFLFVVGACAVGTASAWATEFQRPIVLDTPAPPFRLTVAQLDDAEGADIVTADPLGNSITVILSEGDGDFAEPVQITAGAGAPFVTTMDLDLDDQVDLIATGYPLTVFRGDSTATDGFVATSLTQAAPTNCVTGDFDGEPGDDVAVVLDGFTVAILLNDGEGELSEDGSFEIDGSAIISVAWLGTADMDGDDDLDIVFTSPSKSLLFVMENDGDANFTSRTPIETGPQPWTFALADFDGDGDIDVVTGDRGPLDGKHQLSLMLNNGSGALGDPESLESFGLAIDVAAADLDGDDDVDLVLSHHGGLISTRLNRGDATFLPPESRATGVFTSIHTVGIGDVDGDDLLDIVVPGIQNMDVAILLGTPAETDSDDDDGTSTSAAALVVSPSVLTGRGPHLLQIAGDGFSPAADVTITDEFVVSSVAIDSPTAAVVTLSALRSTGSTTRTITVTNPDGQVSSGTIELRSIEVAVTKGLLKDARRPRRDRVTIDGNAQRTDLATVDGFDPTRSALSIVVSDEDGELFALDVPRADLRWKANRRGRLKWKSGRERDERVTVTYDPATERFSLKVRGFDFARPLGDDVNVAFEMDQAAGIDRGMSSSTWTKRRGALRR